MVVDINPSAARAAPKVTPGVAAPAPKVTAKKPIVRAAKGPRFRILPITMTMLGLLLVLKTNEIYFTSMELRDVLAADAQASAPKKEEKAEGGHGEKKEESGHGGGDKEKEKEKPEPPKISETEIKALKKLDEQTKYNQIELDLLQNLSKRREELDTREKELDLKTKVLEATEQRINTRIDEMKKLETEVKASIDAYTKHQDADVRSLVKIYENMKPSDAANIFNELDMPILLSVIDKMSERKVAPVLAAMNPKKAKDVTEELAELRKAKPLPDAAEAVAAP